MAAKPSVGSHDPSPADNAGRWAPGSTGQDGAPVVDAVEALTPPTPDPRTDAIALIVAAGRYRRAEDKTDDPGDTTRDDKPGSPPEPVEFDASRPVGI